MKTRYLILAIFLISPVVFACFESHYPDIKYLVKPCIIPMADYRFKTCEDWYFRIDDTTYLVPKGFVTDLASIPRWFWSILPPQRTEFIAPAIMHDFIYHSPNGLSRRMADIAFYQGLREEGVDKTTSFKMWLGVRLGGWMFFNKHPDCKHKGL